MQSNNCNIFITVHFYDTFHIPALIMLLLSLSKSYGFYLVLKQHARHLVVISYDFPAIVRLSTKQVNELHCILQEIVI